ncbi:hypothetical protein Tco_1014326 [Tanacetum coccineum]
MIPELGDAYREVPVNETFHEKTDNELSEKELKQVKVDDQSIQTILLGLPEDIYAVVDNCETAQEIWLRVQQMMKGSNIGIQEKKAKLNPNGLIVVSGVADQNPNGNGNVIATRAEGNINGNNGNQIRCYNYRGLGHLARNCTVRPKRRDAAYLQTQLLIAQNEEAGIQLQAKEFDLMATAADLDEIKEVNANCILMANLQQASTSGTQTDKAPVYDSNELAEVHKYDNCYNDVIFNMFTQEEQYTELLVPIPEPYQVQQNDSNVIFKVTSVEQEWGTIEQHSAIVKETAYHESLFHNLAAEVEKVNSVKRKMKETNAELTTELATYKNQEKSFEISQEKYDKLERCYQKSVYQEQCLTKKINALHLSFGKQITTLNEEIANLNNHLSKEKSTVSSLHEEKKRLKFDFKIREDELLDKQIQLENKIKELYNILQAQQKQQSLYNGNVLLDKHGPLAVHDSEETLELIREVQNFKIQFLKEAAKFVRDFKSLAKEADESLAKHKALELEIERLLRAVVSQDIMSIVRNNSVVDTSNLQTELEHTLDPLPQKLENENVELEFPVRNYEKENAHLKTAYKNLFDSINVWICQISQEISQKRTRERMSDQEAKEIKSRSQRDHASAFYSQLQLNHSQPKPTPLF